MTNIIKNYLILLITCLLITLQSCEKDIFSDGSHSNINKLKIEEKSIEDLLFLDEFKTAYNKVNLITTAKRRGTLAEDFNFTIVDTPAKVIQFEGKTTYTLLIKRDFIDFTSLENLVVEIDQNNLMRAVIVKYNLYDEILPSPDNSFYVPTSSKEITTIANEHTNQLASRVTCTITLMCRYLDGPIGSPYSIPHVACSACIDKNDYFLNIDCFERTNGVGIQNNGDPTIPGSGNTGTNHNGGIGNNSSSTSTYSPPPIITSPVVNPPVSREEVALRKTFTDQLSPQQSTFFYSLTFIQRLKIYNFLTNYSITPEQIESGDYIITEYNQNAINLANEAIIRMIANPEIFKTLIPFIIEKNIIDTDLDPCPKSVLTQLKNTTVCDIVQVLAKLDADNTAYNTIIKSEVPPDGNIAQTIRNSSFNYTIFISTNYTGKTKLYIANLLIHEMVHAYFLSIVDDYKSNPLNNQFLYDLNSFPSLFQAYCDKKFPPALGTSQNIHHLEMANYYVDAISRALQEYQTGIPVATNSIPNQICTDLAWGGLNSTPVFEDTYPIGNPNRERILNRYAAEQTGNTIGAGTTNSQTPISQPCN
jgi:hypothetical protein